MATSKHLQKYLAGVKARDAVLNGKRVKFYKDLFLQLSEQHDSAIAHRVIVHLTLRRRLIPANEKNLDFYLVQSRQEGIEVERFLELHPRIQSSVA